MSRETLAKQLELGRHLLKELSKQRVGNRPDRCEPRAVKGRPKPHDLLMKPRKEAQAELMKRRRGSPSAAKAKTTAKKRC